MIRDKVQAGAYSQVDQAPEANLRAAAEAERRHVTLLFVVYVALSRKRSEDNVDSEDQHARSSAIASLLSDALWKFGRVNPSSGKVTASDSYSVLGLVLLRSALVPLYSSYVDTLSDIGLSFGLGKNLSLLPVTEADRG